MQTNGKLPEIRKTVVLNAPVEKVWEAIATSEGITGWWMPNTFKPVIGQEFVLHTGEYGDSPCKVTEIEPLKHVVFDWDKDWTLTLELKALEDGKTEFTLIHAGWDETKKTEFGQPHSMIRDFMSDGWETIVNKSLVKFVEA